MMMQCSPYARGALRVPLLRVPRLLVPRLLVLLLVVPLLLCGTEAHAATLDEVLIGDLSGDAAMPTRWLLDGTSVGQNGQAGHNVLSGTTGRAASGAVDRDYVNIVVPAGFAWTELRVGNQTVSSGTVGSFIGLAPGSFMPVAPSAITANGLLGWRHYSQIDRNTDILDDMAVAAAGSSGFSRPLAAGDYTLWIQELNNGSYVYRFNLVLSPVPEPPAWLLAAAAMAALRLVRGRPPRLRDE